MSTPAGWYPDPTSRHQHRWFDGNDWTDQVADGQVVSTDPVQGGPAAAATQPAATPTPTPDPAATAAIPVAPEPPPGAPGAQPAGTSPLGEYTGPQAASGSGGKGKTVLIVGVALVLVAVAVGLVLTLGGDDDGGGDASASGDQQAEDTTATTDDPSASDLFDDMADTGNDGGDIFGTDDQPADDPADSTVPPDDSGADAYPQEVIDNFTGSCESAGSSATFCGCVIDALQRDVPYDRFVEIDQQLAEDPSNIPSELTDAAEGCQ